MFALKTSCILVCIIFLIGIFTLLPVAQAREPDWNYSSPDVNLGNIGVSANGDVIAAGGEKILFFSKTGTLIEKEPFGGKVMMTSDGKFTASLSSSNILYFLKSPISYGSSNQQKSTRIWEKEFLGRVKYVEMSNDGSMISGIADNFDIFFIDTNTKISKSNTNKNDTLIKIPADGSKVIGLSQTVIRTYSKTGLLVRSSPLQTNWAANILILNSDGTIAVFNDGQTIHCESTNGGKVSWIGRVTGYVKTLSMTPDGSMIIVGTESGNIFSFDAKGNRLWSYSSNPEDRQLSEITSSSLSDNGERIAVGTRDGKILLLNSRGELTDSYKTHEGINSIVVSADDSIVVATSLSKVYAFISGFQSQPSQAPLSANLSGTSLSSGSALNGNGSDQGNTTTNLSVATPEVGSPGLPGTETTGGSSSGGDPGISILLIMLVVLILCGGSVYGFYHLKRKSMGDQTPVREALKIQSPPSPTPIEKRDSATIQPPPSPTPMQNSDAATIQNISYRIESFSKNSSTLTLYQKNVESLLNKARKECQAGNFKNAEQILNDAETAIVSFQKYERYIGKRKAEGYDTSSLESLTTDSLSTLRSALCEYEQNIDSLKKITSRIQEIKAANGSWNSDPDLSRQIVSIESLLKNPPYCSDAEKKVAVLEQTARKLQEKSRTRDDLHLLLDTVRSKADVLHHYGLFVAGSLSEATDQLRVDNFENVRNILRDTEDLINKLQKCESDLSAWQSAGYSTAMLEHLQTKKPRDLFSSFQQYEQIANRLKTVGHALEAMTISHKEIIQQPGNSWKIRSLENNLKNPEHVDIVESEYQQLQADLQKQIEEQKKIQQKLSEDVHHLEQELVSPQTKMEMVPIKKSIEQGDFAGAEKLLVQLAQQQLFVVKSAVSELKTEGAVVSLTYDSIQHQIDAQKYCDAIIESEKEIDAANEFKKVFFDAKKVYATVTRPEIIALYREGNYHDFIRANQEWQAQLKEITALQQKFTGRLAEAKKTVTVPESLVRQATAQDIPTLETAVKNLEHFVLAAKPRLSLTLEKTQFAVNEWHRLPIHIINTGTAHAVNVRFTFTDEFETRWIKPVNIEAGVTTDVVIGLRPKQKGNIPLEIQVQYKDVHNKECQQTFEYWVEVMDSGSVPGIQTPASFTPPHFTPKQFPQELSERYTDWEFIGKGGFARVFKAKRKGGVYVAVKIPISMDGPTGKSFIAEMQNWTKLSHPNIVKLYDFNIMPVPYFEEELCDNSLADLKKPLDCEKSAWILFNICEGLKFAHARKIIHRDLKPQNILMKSGTPKISDWGLSRIISESTATAAFSFTPNYAAPEQIGNKTKDERTDIWQLGVILYELILGNLPFKGESMVEIWMNIATKDPQRPGEIIPGAQAMDAVVMKCLEKDPAKRYQSVLELQKDLAVYRRGNYTELLKTSITAKDYTRSAYYCGDLVMINFLTGDIATSYKYLLDLVHYSKGEVKAQAQELSEQIKLRMEMGLTEIPAELIQKAEILVHKVSAGLRQRR